MKKPPVFLFVLLVFTGAQALGGCMALVEDAPVLPDAGTAPGTGGGAVVGSVGSFVGRGGSPVVTSTGGASTTGSSTGGRSGSGGATTTSPDAGAGTGGRANVPDGGAPDGSPAGSGGLRGTGGAGTGGARTGGAPGSGGAPGTGGASTAAVCTSNVTWDGSTGPNMRPGISCRGCHSYAIAGTVYPTLHEPTNCNGTNASGLRVIITGADGATLTLTPNAAGNFFSSSSVATPFTARVTSSAGTRMMGAMQTSGDCNSCHTQTGANGAPGRIMAP